MDELACIRIFGAVRGQEVIELVERTSGQVCPCRRGLVCPLLEALAGAAPVAVSA